MNKRILCVDDHDDICSMLRVLLGEQYEVETASNIAEALELSRRERFDLFILDSRFPDGAGLDLSRRLRSLHPQTPVIFYSGAAYKADRESARDAGAYAYVVKPEIEGLVVAVRQAID